MRIFVCCHVFGQPNLVENAKIRYFKEQSDLHKYGCIPYSEYFGMMVIVAVK